MLNPNQMTEEEEQIEYVKEFYYNIKHIDNPSNKVCLSAIKEDYRSIKCIKNPTEEMCLIAVQNDRSAIQFIQKPTMEMLKLTLNKGYELWHTNFEDVVNKWSSEIQDYINKYREVDDILC
jgi:hypothetical protein